MGRLVILAGFGLGFLPALSGWALDPPPAGAVRIATYNIAMYRDEAGQLFRELASGKSVQAAKVAEVLQRVRPDVVLLNEFDYEESGAALKAFREEYLATSQAGLEPLEYPYAFYRPVNTGVDSTYDLDGDGKTGAPADAFGFGQYPGKYGMVVLSKHPIDETASRTFQKFLWKNQPGALLTKRPDGSPFYGAEAWENFRLSSKSHWDVAVKLPNRTLHLLCSHPTPPVFDGPEDRNGLRNHDEIRLIADYATGGEEAEYIVDDASVSGGLANGEAFVVLGDLNADPVDGDTHNQAIKQLLKHPRINSCFTPTSAGGKLVSEQYVENNSAHHGDPTHDTGNFSVDGQANLRCDYALPSRELEVLATGVFWPTGNEPGAEAVTGSDHRLVWVDVK
jgi:endonuclease/exonuclease/phosphatase family metal-dependent hydrolase